MAIWFQLTNVWLTCDFHRLHPLGEEQLLEPLFLIERRLD